MNIEKCYDDYIKFKNNLDKVDADFQNQVIGEAEYGIKRSKANDELKNVIQKSLAYFNQYIKDNLQQEFNVYKKGTMYNAAFKPIEGTVKKSREEFLNDYDQLISLATSYPNSNPDLSVIITIIKDYYIDSLASENN